jgi:hypothetical protein
MIVTKEIVADSQTCQIHVRNGPRCLGKDRDLTFYQVGLRSGHAFEGDGRSQADPAPP